MRTITVTFRTEQEGLQRLPFWKMEPVEVNGHSIHVVAIGDGNKFSECDDISDLLDSAEEVIQKNMDHDKYATELTHTFGVEKAKELTKQSNILDEGDIDGIT